MQINWLNVFALLIAIVLIFGAGAGVGLLLNDAHAVGNFQALIIGSLCFIAGGCTGIQLAKDEALDDER